MTGSGSPFGWDLLVKSEANEINTPEDVLLCFTHLVLVNYGFRCIGLGESKNLSGTEVKTEALPNGWAADGALRYVYQGRLYTLKSTKLDSGIMVNLLRVDEKNISLVQLENTDVRKTTPPRGLEQMIPGHVDLANLIRKQLIDKATVSKKSKESSCQTDQLRLSHQPQRSSSPDLSYPTRDPRSVGPPPPPPPPPSRPAGVGEFDLNPFARPFPNVVVPPPAGGGMLYEPPRLPQNPPGVIPGVAPGSVPPGARFDPFRPPDANQQPRRRFGPDNDELPPPGYDDMFM